MARRLRFCRATKREERLHGRFPGRRALVEGCAMALQRDQAGQGERKDTSGMEAWGGGAHLRRVRVEFPSERASELRARAWWASERRGGVKSGTCRGGAAAERPAHGGTEPRRGGGVLCSEKRQGGRLQDGRGRGRLGRGLKEAGRGLWWGAAGRGSRRSRRSSRAWPLRAGGKEGEKGC